jgi:RNA polymerase sigma-70 factor (ECF subfamily)
MGSASGPDLNIVELVERHYAELFRYAYRLSGQAADAEDLTQQAFLTAQKKLDQVRDLSHARSWLFTITRNAYLKSVRSLPAAPHVSLDIVGEPEDPAAGEMPVDSEQLQGVLNELPEEFRTPIILFYFEEFSYKEIADQLDVPIGTVMSRLSRGKAFLRRRLTGLHADEPESDEPSDDSSDNTPAVLRGKP